jgi:HEAT repeat protein
VLSLISAKTKISITPSEELPVRRFSIRIEAQRVESALWSLLTGTDTFVLYSVEDGVRRLSALWVYPRGGARDIAPVPKQLWASTQEFESQLADHNPEARGRAIEELIERGGEAALARALEALSDQDAGVRQRALDAALDAELDLPLERVELLVTGDRSPEVRLRALQTLEQHPDATATIEAATFDADAHVRGEALSIMARLKRRPR